MRGGATSSEPRVACASYKVGHTPHPIQVRLSQEQPWRPGTARRDGGGWVVIDLDDGERLRRWSHDERRLDEIVGSDHGRVVLRPKGVLVDSSGSGRVASVSHEASPCTEASQNFDPATEIVERGGFLFEVTGSGAAGDEREVPT